MRQRGLVTGFAVSLCVATTARAAADKPVPLPSLETYAALPSLEFLRLSPSGERLAFVRAAAEGRELVVIDRKTRALVTGSKLGDAKVRAVNWTDNDHVILTYSTTKDAIMVDGPRRESYLATAFDLRTKQARGLLQDADDDQVEHMNTIVSRPMVRSVQGATSIFISGITFPPAISLAEGKRYGLVSLFRIDAEGRHEHLIQQGQPDTVEWWVSSAGDGLLRLDYDSKSGRAQLFASVSGRGMQKILDETSSFGAPSVLGFSSDGLGVLMLHRRSDDVGDVALVRIDAITGKETLVRAGDVADYIEDPATGAVIGSVANGFTGQVAFFDPKEDANWRAIAKAFEGMNVAPESWSADRKSVVVDVDGAPAGAGYAIVDVKLGRASYFGDRYRGVGPDQMGVVRTLAYKAADGTEIPALLTYPVGVDPDKAPKGMALIVLPHGGPGASDSLQFDWLSQSLASQGWAVLQPQFRGSTGFGDALYQGGFGEWGRKMQSDLSDGVRDLAKTGVIDPQRVAILGASYGGYAALAGAAFEGRTYRCAVSIAGLSDLKRMLAWEADQTGSRRDSTQRYWNRFMGAKDRNDPILDQISPAKHAADVAIPVMLIHGKDDTVVDIEQSRIMAAALTSAGKPVELVTLAGEDHWLSRPDTRVKTMVEAVKFLKRCNPAA